MQSVLGSIKIQAGRVTSSERISTGLREQSEGLVLFLKGNYFML